jgi:hypothetical protein
MKRTLLSAILLAGLASIACAELPWREFKSADGTQTFVGQLLSYKKAEESITVRLKATMQSATLKLDRLSEDDRAYVKAEAANLAANASFELGFAKLLEPTGSDRKDTTRTKSYNGGYKIEVASYSPEAVEDVEVEYVVIYLRDEIDGKGERLLHGGSKHFDTLPANSTTEVLADGVELEDFVKEGTTEVKRRGSYDANGNSNATLKVTKAQKRRDVLIGCIARVTVAGKIVHTEASSPDILRQYADAFGAGKSSAPARPKGK